MRCRKLKNKKHYLKLLIKKTFIYRILKRAEKDNTKYIESFEDRIKRQKKIKEALRKYNTTTKAAILYADIYDIVYYADERENYYFPNADKIFLQAREAAEQNDIYILTQMLEWVQSPQQSRLVPFICQDILNFDILKSKEDEVLEYLSFIKTNDEAIIVYDSVSLWIENYKYLPRGYNEAKKQKSRRKKSTMTYEHRLRIERHYLERELTKIGTGINRAKKLSQILLLIN